jgi:photosystem II stability/assembly factor-like uncharacterized protein
MVPKNTARYIIGGVVIAVAVFAIVAAKRSPAGPSTGRAEWRSERAVTHGHGLAVDVADANVLYIATHRGLLALEGERDLYRVGRSRDDLMGFSIHPTDPKAFFSSGHPQRGGNLGMQRSDDRGITWRKIASGIDGPVDFHALAVSPMDPQLMYGWFGALQRSADGGQTWERLDTTLAGTVQLVGDPRTTDRVYAATRSGLFISGDRGMTWTDAAPSLSGSTVTAVNIDPRDGSLLAFAPASGLVRIGGNGTTPELFGERFGGDAVLFLARDSRLPDRVYALTAKNAIYRSSDSGTTWVRIRS